MHCLYRERKQPKETCWCSKNHHQESEVSSVCFWRDGLQWVRASSFTRFLNHTQRGITECRNPVDELSVRQRDLYLKTHNSHNGQTSMPPVGFETTISAGERPQTYAVDSAALGNGRSFLYMRLMCNECLLSRSVRVAWGNILQSLRTYLASPSGCAIYGARLLKLHARISPGAWQFVCSEFYVCCQVDVSATSWSLVQKSSTDCGVSLCTI